MKSYPFSTQSLKINFDIFYFDKFYDMKAGAIKKTALSI